MILLPKKYFLHFIKNVSVAFMGMVLVVFHVLHAIIPIKYTSHEYWGIRLTKEK